MHKLLLISNTKNYFNITIAKQLEEKKHIIYETLVDKDEINKLKDTIDAVLLFVDEELLEHHQDLTFIKDTLLENDTPLFLLGGRNEIDSVKKYMPENLIQKEFIRPIDVGELVTTVDDFLLNLRNYLKKKILVVDDSGAMLRSVKGWLDNKYQVALANSGAMAIKYLTLNRPDLILLDYEMPIVNGKQVLEMIRSEIEFSDIPVIFLTSKSDKETVLEVMDLKPEGYLLKTMPPEEIIHNIDEFFIKRKALEY